MLVRLIILGFLVAAGVAVYRFVRRQRLPARWLESAEHSSTLRRVLERRGRVAALVRRTGDTYVGGLLSQTDTLIESLVELVDARTELREHVGERALGSIAEPLRLALTDIEARLAEAEAQVAEACDQVVAIAGADANQTLKTARARLDEQTERLRISVSSYDEARRIARGETE